MQIFFSFEKKGDMQIGINMHVLVVYCSVPISQGVAMGGPSAFFPAN
jgi:hypothetical protein